MDTQKAMVILCKLETQDADPDVFLVISYIDSSGKNRYELFPIELTLEEKKAKTWLIKRGFPQNLLVNQAWTKIFETLNVPVTKTGTIVEKFGYFLEKNYFLPDNSFIGSEEAHTVYLHPKKSIFRPDYSKSGSLDEWKEKIATSALHSTRIMMGLCAGLSGYVLKIVGIIESGGFNLFGASSIGKTTVLKATISLAGPRCNLQSWNQTDTGVEELAYGYNDGFITFDEIKTIDPNDKEAIKKLSAIIYRLCSGIERNRSRKYKPDQDRWRTSIMSTGEVSLAMHAEKAGSRRMEGEEVRVIDVPADAGNAMGIFESLPEEFTDSSTYAQYLDEQSQLFYGTPQAAFLEELIANLSAENPETPVKVQLIEWMELFRKKCGVDPKSGIEVRFTNRFALAYAAGCLAVDYGIFPFTRKDVFKGISACYKAALSVKPESWEAKVNQQKSTLAKYLDSQEFLALDSKESWSVKVVAEIDGFSVSINDIPLIALKREVVKHLIPEIYLNDVLRICKSKGYLLSDANGNNTRSITLNGKKVRFYCFVSPADKESVKVVRKQNQGYAAKISSE
ncbi:DUF927 domain-containing protein [Nitrosomonas supralitoralis]|nr:DUF927 domain-containing protein [Nitrosomonas supralitoralis]